MALTRSALLLVVLPAASFGYSAQELWQRWPAERFITTPAPCLHPAELVASLQELQSRHPERLQLEEVGRSFLGRPIHLVTLGQGPRKVLLWSQMHGDEPSATPALLDLADFLLRHAGEPSATAILADLTLLMIPMLNPDGAEIYQRRNAQAIDINRDALNLATPEGRILKEIRERHAPLLGLNLHDQNRRKSVGDSGVLATNAVLAVAGDPEGTITPGRLRAKRACAAIVEALAPFAPGGMARYEEDWNPRAFGDNLTAWGMPVVLLESGGLPPGRDLSELTRLNFVALISVLQRLAADDLAGFDPAVYDDLLRNESDSWSDVAIRGGYLLQPGTSTPYRADLSFNLLSHDRVAAGCGASERSGSRIFEIGDSQFFGAGRDVDATGGLVVAPFVVGVDGWSARRWLDGGTLDGLSRLGVGTVRWTVATRRLAAARSLARTLAAQGRARLEVVGRPTPLPWARLTAPPPMPDSDALDDIVAALAGRTWRERVASRPPLEALQSLWTSGSEGGDEKPLVRPGVPASFLLLSPALEGRIDLSDVRLRGVWIDGVEVVGERRGGER